MDNIIDYAESFRESFNKVPFHAVDSLILSQLAYLNWSGIVPSPDEYLPNVRLGDVKNSIMFSSLFANQSKQKENEKLLLNMTDNPRFCDIELNYYTAKTSIAEQKQFSAITYFLTDGSAYVAYRGTDGTAIGWKEDFNMAFLTPVPAQVEGVSYLEKIADKVSSPLMVGGHSKGGNIAIYSAMEARADIKRRLMEVFNHDGPGFKDEIAKSQKYIDISDRVNITVPQDSFVGMLMNHAEEYYVVKSNKIWIWQHDPFSWEVKDGHFVYLKHITESAALINYTANAWLGLQSNDERKIYSELLYKLLQVNELNSQTYKEILSKI